MDKINFQDGVKVSNAKVTIDEVDYTVTPARYSGATPLSSTIMNAMQANIENAINQNANNIGGEDYDNTETYEVGDIVKYEEQLYICIENVDTPEEFDDTKWSQTDVLSSAGGNEIVNSPSDSTTETYSCNYINNLNTYSTTEHRIGTWIDGKPLYRKVIVATGIQASGAKSVVHNISNLGNVTNISGSVILNYDTGNFKRKAPLSQLPASWNTFINIGETAVIINRTTSGSELDIIIQIVLEYTKTTD